MRKFVPPSLTGPTEYTESLFIYWERALDLLGCDLVIDGGIIYNGEHGHDLLKESLTSHEEILSQLLFAAHVDNFQSYLTDLLLEILEARPRILASGQTKNETVFDSPDLESLKRYIIEKHVVNLGYKKVEDLDEYFNKTLNFNLTAGRFQELRLTRIIQLRNIIAHNRGLISTLFLARAGAKADVVGQRAQSSNLYTVQNFLMRIAIRLDTESAAKFGLKLDGIGEPLLL